MATDFSTYDEPREPVAVLEDPRDPDAPRDADPPYSATALQDLRDFTADYWDLHHTIFDGSIAPGWRKCTHCWGPVPAVDPTCNICKHPEE